jgi:L-rhamnose-H+ transport protein
MRESLTSGLVLVLLAGVCQGSFMLPSKAMRGWAWENYWLIFAITAYLISPWLLAFATVPHLLDVYAGVSAGSLGMVVAFGTLWGIGALTFGLGVEALGLALGFAVILGATAVFGTVIPLLVQTPKEFSRAQAWLTGASLLLMMAGIAVCSLAGKWKETRIGEGQSYRRGLLICLVSGLLSACGNLGLVFGSEIVRRAIDAGAPDQLAANAVWTLLTLPLFLCNASYAIYLLRRNATQKLYRAEHAPRYFALAVSMGALWMSGFGLYGMGTRRLGDLGASLGWAMMMSTIVLVANALGIVTGEWNGAPAASKRRLAAGVFLVTCAVAGLGWANR